VIRNGCRLAASVLATILSLSAAPQAADDTPIQLSYDLRVPAEFLRLVKGRIIDDDSLDAWLDLPGNVEILRLGEVRGRLSREGLRENLWHSILGHRLQRGRGLGSLAFDPLDDLGKILDDLQGRTATVTRRVVEHVLPYIPPGLDPMEVDVRFHLGGTWSSRAGDAIYINLSFFHQFESPRLEGLEAVIAHELAHLAQLKVGPLPRDAKTAEGVFGVALAQIHAEGIARHVEYQLLEGENAAGTYAALAFGRYEDALGSFHASFSRVDEIRDACLREKALDQCRELIRKGLGAGGVTHAIGHGMALAIERALGRETLTSTLGAGPEKFFDLYLQATRKLPGFPVPGEGFRQDLEAAGAALDRSRRSWQLRRDAREAHMRGEYERAASLLKEVTELAPRDAVTAYNLACALARAGEGKEAVEWLERAVDYGYTNRALMVSDPDLESLRESRGYRRLLERMGGPSSVDPNASRK
jgi:tetratricopeptide (TPR) repeat protein